jgi:hypothetical protein
LINSEAYPFVNIVDNHTGLCLEARHVHLGGVYTRACDTASVWQGFLIQPGSSGWWFYDNSAGTGLCLVGGNTGAVYMAGCREPGDAKQQWNLLPPG